MNLSDTAIVYFNPHTLKHKQLADISAEQIKQAFAREDLEVFTDSELLVQRLLKESWINKNLLLMSSGNFGGVDYNELVDKIILK